MADIQTTWTDEQGETWVPFSDYMHLTAAIKTERNEALREAAEIAHYMPIIGGDSERYADKIEEEILDLITKADHNKPSVKPLKWYGDFAHNDMGGSYQLDSAGGGILTLYFHTGVGKVEMAVADNIPELEKAANAHHERLVLANLEDV